jgi:hypothetical protein
VGIIHIKHSSCPDRVLAQAVSPRLPIAAARVRAQFKSSEICGGQSGSGAGSIDCLTFPRQSFIPPIAHHHHLLSIAGTIDQWFASVIVDSVLIQPNE